MEHMSKQTKRKPVQISGSAHETLTKIAKVYNGGISSALEKIIDREWQSLLEQHSRLDIAIRDGGMDE